MRVVFRLSGRLLCPWPLPSRLPVTVISSSIRRVSRWTVVVCVSAQRWPVARAPSRHSPESLPAPSPPCRGSGPLCASGASADERRPGHEPAPGPPDSLAMGDTRRRNGCGTRAVCLLAVSTTLLLLRCQGPSAYTPFSASLPHPTIHGGTSFIMGTNTPDHTDAISTQPRVLGTTIPSTYGSDPRKYL